MWDARRLLVLRAVARHRSFTAAAADLFTTQPAVSRQIAALEQELGVVLVARPPHRTALTAAGADLLASADRVLGELDAIARRMASLAAPEGGRVRLGAVPSAMADLVPRAIAELRDRRSRVELTVEEGWSPDLTALVEIGDLDVAVVTAPRPSSGPASVSDRLLTEPFDVVLPTSDPLASRTRPRLRDLPDSPFILAPAVAGQQVVRVACAAAGFVPRVAATATWDATGPLVATGIGVALAPRSTAHRLARWDGVVVRALAGSPRRSLHLVSNGMSPTLESDVRESFRAAARALHTSSP